MIIANRTNSLTVTNFTADELKKNNDKNDGEFDFSTVKAVSFEEILSRQGDPSGLSVIGGIAIPDVKLNLPIFRGVGNAEISYGAGTMKPDEVMGQGNYALASHRVSGFHLGNIANADEVAGTLLFHPLERTKPGMAIYITDMDTVYEYKVTSKEQVTPDHVQVIDDVPGKTLITLVTCAEPGMDQRVIVHGEFVKKYAYDKAPLKVNEAFQMKYNTWQW
jgi:sortase A